jgi:hypothetical protein
MNYRLSSEQKGYYADRHNGGRVVMMPTLLMFALDVDVVKLVNAFRRTVKAHPIIQANVHIVDGKPCWKRQDDADVVPVNVRNISEGGLKTILNTLIRRKEFHPDLADSPLYFAEIYCTEKAVYLLMAFHHIGYDGVTRNILIDNILAAYNGQEIKRDSGRGFEEGNDELAYQNSSGFARSEQFYGELLQHYTKPLVLSVPKDSVSPKRERSLFHSFDTLLSSLQALTPSARLSKQHTANTADAFVAGNLLREFCAAQEISPNAVFLAGLCKAASQFSGSRYLFFSTETAGRVNRNLENEAGLFVRTFLLGIKVDSALPPLELLYSVKEQYYHILKNHSAYTADFAMKKWERRNHFNYLFQADTYTAKPKLPQPAYDDRTCLVTSKLFASSEVHFDCDVQIYNFDLPNNTKTDRYMINVRYDRAVYSPALMRRFADAIRSFIEKLY